MNIDPDTIFRLAHFPEQRGTHADAWRLGTEAVGLRNEENAYLVTSFGFYRQTIEMLTSRAMAGVVLALGGIYFQEAAWAESPSYAVFRSEDGGDTWARSGAGLDPDARINAFGASGSALLAGTDHGLYVSSDQGRTWKLGGGAAARRILSFSTLGDRVFAGTDADAILVSSDGGATWVVQDGLPFRKIRSLLAHDGALYAGSDAQGVFVSRDAGQSWTSMSQGLPGGAQIFSMADINGSIFAGLYSKGLYAWEDRGLSWRKVGTVVPLVLASTGETLLAGHNPGGIFRSDDSGQTWGKGEIAPSADLGNAPVWEAGAGPELALAGVSSRIYRSRDHGRTWSAAVAGLPNGSSGIAFHVTKMYVLAGVAVPAKARPCAIQSGCR